MKRSTDSDALKRSIATELSVSQLPSSINLTPQSSKSADALIPTEIQDATKAEQLSTLVSPDRMSTNASLFAENTTRILAEKYGYSENELTYCNGIMGVPITFLDKYNPEEFVIIGATESEGKGFSCGIWDATSSVMQPVVAGERKYKRIFIKHTEAKR